MLLGLLYSVPLIVDPCLHQRLLDADRHVWLSLLWGHCSFLLGPGVHEILSVPSKSLFLQSCVSSVIKSHCPTKSNSLGVSASLPDPQVGKSVVGPRTFLTVWEFLWYNCFAVCGSSARQVYGGANGDLLQELPKWSMQRNRGKQQNEKDYRSLQENLRYQGNISCKDGNDKGQKWYGPNRNRRY